MPDDVDRVVVMALANPVNRAILDRGPGLGAPDWWLTGGAVFQSVWNALDGRDPRAGITDHDLFYFDDSDLSWESEDEVVQRAAALFADVDAVVEVRNEARVHLWYAEHFGAHGVAFTCTRDAIDHFAATACCLGLTCAVDGTGRPARAVRRRGRAGPAAAAEPGARAAGGVRGQGRPLAAGVARAHRRPVAECRCPWLASRR